MAVSRHGVRVPYGVGGAETMNASQFKPYTPAHYKGIPVDPKQWGAINPGKPASLTLHGQKAVALLGRQYAARYTGGTPGGGGGARALLGPAGDPGACALVRALSDNTERDLATAAAFLGGMLPQCAGGGKITPSIDGSKYLFNMGAITTDACQAGTPAQVGGLMGVGGAAWRAGTPAGAALHGLAGLDAELSGAIGSVGDALGCCAPALCPAGARAKKQPADGGKAAPAPCTIDGLPVAWTPGAWYGWFTGPLATASYFSNFVMMALTNGMQSPLPLAQQATGTRTRTGPAPAPLSLAPMLDAFEANRAYIGDFVANDWSARSFASTLMHAILGDLEAAAANSSANGDAGGRFVYYAGHDMNILMLRRLLGVSWGFAATAGNQNWRRNTAPPGGMLVFELWQAPCEDKSGGDASGGGGGCDGDFSVRLFYEAASPWEIRNATAPNPATSRVPIAIPRCVSDAADGVSCPLPQFAAIVRNAVRPECIMGAWAGGGSGRDEL